MLLSQGLQRLVAMSTRRPALTLGVVLALALAGGALSLGLRPTAATDTFVSRSSSAYRATLADERSFGDDAVVLLVHEPVTRMLRAPQLSRLTQLEACLAGQYVQRSARLHADLPVSGHSPYGGASSPCGELAALRAAKVVYGPGTFLNRAVAAVNSGVSASLAAARGAGDRAAAAARRLALARGLSSAQAGAAASVARATEEGRQLARLEKVAAGAGLSALPSITDTAFVRRIVFGSATATTPQSRFAYLFPDADDAIIQVRLRASLSAAQQSRAIGLIRRALRMGRFAGIGAGSGAITVTGVPVVVHDLAAQITGAIGGLLIAALIVMALALLLVFRSRRRLLPLLLALAATGITFGLLSLFGVALTMASIAVLPIMIGLGVDYGIQFQSRARDMALASPAGTPTQSAATRSAVLRAGSEGAPAIVAAAAATVVGFCVLQLSPVPMVRGFGLVLVIGIVVSLLCALTAGPAALVASGDGTLGAALRGAGEILAPPVRGTAEIFAPAVRGAGEILGPSLRGAGELLRWPHRSRLPERMLSTVVRHPVRVLAVATVLAATGWVADGRTAVQSDITRLVPQSMPAMVHLRRLEAVTGVSGEIDVAVTGADVATPATVSWMAGYENRILAHFGYREAAGCAIATLCPALSLPDLFSTATGSGTRGESLTQARIDALLRAVPSYFSSAVLTPSRRAATLAFGIRLMPLARQQRVIRYMSSQLDPPPGIHAALTGLPVLAAQANAELASSGRRLLTLVAGLVAVALVLLLIFRRPARALIPVAPIVLATGWSALVLYLVSIPLNPMSATLGSLVIAISTEFSVLLSERFRQEWVAGGEPVAALLATYRSTGSAVLASGITAIAGFGVLAFSDIAMLRDFGLVTLIDLAVSLSGVLLILPAVIVLAPRRGATGTVAGPTARRALGRPRSRRVTAA